MFQAKIQFVDTNRGLAGTRFVVKSILYAFTTRFNHGAVYQWYTALSFLVELPIVER